MADEAPSVSRKGIGAEVEMTRESLRHQFNGFRRVIVDRVRLAAPRNESTSVILVVRHTTSEPPTNWRVIRVAFAVVADHPGRLDVADVFREASVDEPGAKDLPGPLRLSARASAAAR